MPRTGFVNYHLHTSQRQAYRIDADGVSGSLMSPEHVPTEVVLRDQRANPTGTSFTHDGIGFMLAPTAIEVTQEGWQDAYEAELIALLTRTLEVDAVRVFDHTLRVDDAAALRRPARNVHADYSPQGARARLETLLGPDDAAAWDAGHYAFVNVWRPVSDIVLTAPLGFVRPRTVRPEDWLTLDLVYPDRIGQIMGLVGNPEHEWLYRSEMTCDEVVMFNIHDNRGRPPVAHSAVDLIESPPGVVRKSIESRTLIRYRV